MASSKPPAGISSGVSKLSLKTPAPKGAKAQNTKNPPAVADSWEDEDISSASEAGDDTSDHEQERDRQASRASSSKAGTAAPPPTPMSPTYGSRVSFPPANVNAASFDLPSFDASGSSNSASATKRPEKTDAVARRMIASALGVKAPKQTEEQKAYDRAMREKERRRREEEKERERKREEEAARAKEAVWED